MEGRGCARTPLALAGVFQSHIPAPIFYEALDLLPGRTLCPEARTMTSRVCPAFQLQMKEIKLNPAKAKGDFNSFKVQEGQLQAWLDPGVH